MTSLTHGASCLLHLLGPPLGIALCLASSPIGCFSESKHQTALRCVQAPPRFSNDGTKILFASPRTGHGDIYLANVDGTGCTQLTRDSDPETYPVFSPAGDRIAYVRTKSPWRVQHLWAMDVNGAGQTQLTDGDFVDEKPRFGADPKTVLFYRRIRIASDTIEAFPMAANLDGTGFGKREEKEIDASFISTPDGRVSLEIEGRPLRPDDWTDRLPRLWVTKDGEGQRRFLTDGGSPVLSGDGSQIFFQTEGSAASPWAVIRADGTGRRTLALPNGVKSMPSLSPDGNKLAIAITSIKEIGDFGVYVVDLVDYSVKNVDCGSVGADSR